MKVFISSIIGGFEAYRAACKGAITTLRHQPVMAEDFGAQPRTPQIACLQGVRESDLVVLVLGERYGAVQPGSGVSATHEEYRDAKGRKPVIAFVQNGVTPEAEQASFIEEVQSWEGGLFRGSFRTAEDLRDNVIRALHDHTIANMAGPLDPNGLVNTALSLLPEPDRHSTHTPMLSLAIAGGPRQSILRPAELEEPALAEALHQAALFGETRIFGRRHGVDIGLDGAALIVKQDDGGYIRLDEQGALLLRLTLEEQDCERRRGYSFSALIEERVLDRLQTGLGYASWVLDQIDKTQRLTHVAVAARIDASGHMAWRTQREQDQNPTSGTMGWGNDDKRPVTIDKPRPALRLDRRRTAEDLMVPLRRQWKTR